jgi:glycine cleavage system transcriptional repressor
MNEMKEYIVTVMAQDRAGIIAGIAEAVGELNGNIQELSQTVVRGYFTIILSATFGDDVSPDVVREGVRASGAPGELEVAVRERMPSGSPQAAQERFILTVLGRDQPGVVHHICSYLAGEGISISDFYGRVDADRFEMIVELQMPPDKDPLQLKESLERLGRAFGMSAHFQHENLFIATNSVQPVRALAGGAA